MSHKITEKLKRFPISIPEPLHRDFKLLCVREGVPMTERIRSLLAREVAADADASTTKPAKKPGRSAPPENAHV